MSDAADHPADAFVVRPGRLSDVRRASVFIRELAGDAPEPVQRRRFRRMVLRPSYKVFIAAPKDDPLSDEPVSMLVAREGYFLGADAPFLQILGWAVRPELQRQGLGLALAQRFMSEVANSSNYSQVWTVTQHEYLHSLYELIGFEQTGTRFVYHERGGGRPSVGRRITRRLGI